MSKDSLLPQYRSIVYEIGETVSDQIDRYSNAETKNKKTGLYLVTTHFKEPNYLSTNERKLQYVIDATPRVHAHILNKTVKHHKYKNRRKLHPYMISFVDYSGSREHLPNFNQLPHIHSILVVHPDVNERFHVLKENKFRLDEASRTASCVREIDVREISNTKEDLLKVIDYSAKSYFLKFIPNVSEETKASMIIYDGAKQQ